MIKREKEIHFKCSFLSWCFGPDQGWPIYIYISTIIRPSKYQDKCPVLQQSPTAAMSLCHCIYTDEISFFIIINSSKTSSCGLTCFILFTTVCYKFTKAHSQNMSTVVFIQMRFSLLVYKRAEIVCSKKSKCSFSWKKFKFDQKYHMLLLKQSYF